MMHGALAAFTESSLDHLYSFVSPALLSTLGSTLLHFLWQGALLALVLQVATVRCTDAIKRYRAGVTTLALMLAAPLITFALLWPSSKAEPALWSSSAAHRVASNAAQTHLAPILASSIPWLPCLAAIWFAGVLTLAIRALGGWWLVERLYRSKRQLLPSSLMARCHALQTRLGIKRRIEFFLTSAIDVPATVGWLRPAVLLPLTALTALSPEQLEAIIIHELAHVRRLDFFVNMFQIAAETLLFYHPATWWVSRFIRTERENCCDDIAVSLCGDLGVYARALTLVATWRQMPSLLVAANSGSLKCRIERLLGASALKNNISLAGLLASALIFSASIVLASAAVRPDAPHASVATPAPPSMVKPHVAIQIARMIEPVVAQDDEQPAHESKEAKHSSYIDELHAAGFNNIDVDQLIGLKVQGVTPEYIRDLRSAGLKPDLGELIALKVQGVTPDYVRQIRHDWPGTETGEIIAMKVQGVRPSDAAAYRTLGLQNLEAGQLIAFHLQGVTPDYVRSLQAAGFKELSSSNIIAAKVQGITPEFIRNARAHGFTNLSFHQLMSLKVAGVF